nr:immunoglobulin heavy chain junction region [Macaca mulatta]MOV48477.1 immunoglobulin heavy chain junction region [Macaca mulatta]MOV48507.1 immunoglobulin heavy chain junction region [Macaca mulatta]
CARDAAGDFDYW